MNWSCPRTRPGKQGVRLPSPDCFEAGATSAAVRPSPAQAVGQVEAGARGQKQERAAAPPRLPPRGLFGHRGNAAACLACFIDKQYRGRLCGFLLSRG